MDLLARLPKAALVTVVALVVFAAPAGFAIAQAQETGIPETFQVAPPRVGDEWEYEANVVAVVDGEDEDAKHDVTRFRWDPAMALHDRDGVPRHVHPLVDVTNNHTAFVDMESLEVVASAFAYQSNASHRGWTSYGVLPSLTSTRTESTIDGQIIEYHEYPLPCGFATELHDREIDVDAPVEIYGACGWSDDDPGVHAARATGSQTLHGIPVVGFTISSDGGTVVLWYNRDIPVPVLIELDIEVEWDFEIFGADEPLRVEIAGDVRLDGFVPGDARWGIPGGPLPPPLTPVPTRTATTLSVDDRDLDHPFRLSEAFDVALQDPTYPDLREFMAANPGARAVAAQAWRAQDGDHDVYGWTFRMWNDGRDIVSGAERRIARDGTPSSVLQLVTGPDDRGGRSGLSVGFGPDLDFTVVDESRLPDRVPVVAVAAQRFTESTGLAANDYGFDYTCTLFCWFGGTDALYVGYDERIETEPDLVTGEPGHIAAIRHRFHFTDEGTLAFQERITEEGTTTSSLGGQSSRPQVYADAAPIQARALPLWLTPSREAAAGVGFMAILVGAAYWLWPTIKAGGVVGLFSRVRPDQLLEHPLRARIYETVQEHPGIHYQAIVRHTGKGRGVMEHHLRKLEQGGLIVTQSNRGHKCYFAKGAMDHSIMAAVPALKTKGAVRVLRQIIRDGDTTVTALAEDLGIAKSTASHHVRRLREAGLIESAGRIAPTPAARKALAVAA